LTLFAFCDTLWDMIRENLNRVRDEINDICRSAGRNSDEITLVGVTKFAPVEAIQEAMRAGMTDIAENRVQEAEKKFPLCAATNPEIRRHLIGHLQTNKAKDAIAVCDLIQSVDSLKLAQEIQKQALKVQKTVNILVQFNTAREPQKFGASPEEAPALIEAVGALSHIRIQGLMAMAPYTEDEGTIRRAFSDLREIRDQIQQRFSGHPRTDMKILSMGMSSDYRIAIEEGSNMVRVGSAIFKEAYVQEA
jgi:pyridoxal phosphate enzyme (YggS family)